MIEVRCCHSLAEAASFREAINALNLASARPDPFSTFEFYEHWLREAARDPKKHGLRLWLILAFSGGELVGYAALKQLTHRILGIPAAKIDWLTAYVFGQPHLVSKPGQAGAVGAAIRAYLLSRKREWSLLEFQQQDPDSALVLSQPEITSPDLRLRSWPNAAHWRIPVQGRSLAGYFAALPKKSRSNISRQMRSLMAAGEVRLLCSSDPPTIVPLFGLYQHIESQSWKARIGDEMALDRRSLSYYRRLLACDQPMLIVIQVLMLDGMPIGGLICGAFDRGLYALDIVYDERYARLAPGSAMLLLGMRLAIEGGFEFFDLLRGFGYYKSRWLAEGIEAHSLQIYRKGSLFDWRRRGGDALRRWTGRASIPDDLPYNTTRREALEPPPKPVAESERRVEHARLVATALGGCGEFLDAAQLGLALPFATGLKPEPKIPTARQQFPAAAVHG